MLQSMTKEAIKAAEHSLNLFRSLIEPTKYATFQQQVMIKAERDFVVSRCNSKTRFTIPKDHLQYPFTQAAFF